MLFVTVLFWWFSYRWYQDATSATIAGFLPKLLFLLIAFLMIAASLPDEVPNEGLDLREFYLSSRTHLWPLVTLSLIVIVVINIVDRGVGWFDISRFWPQLISIALAGTAGSFSCGDNAMSAQHVSSSLAPILHSRVRFPPKADASPRD